MDYLPSPHDVPAMEGHKPRTEDVVTREADPDAPFAAIAFKIATDPYVGRLTFARVYSGRLNKGDALVNANNEKKERAGRLLFMHANTREDVDTVKAGDICAIVGLKDTKTGDTLCDPDHPVVLEAMDFPEPVIKIAIEPKTKADIDKLGVGLQKLAEEDPTFKVSSDEETGQTLIAGMGELHLEIIVDRLKREFKVEANVGEPQVSYRRGDPEVGRPHLHAQEAVGRPRPVPPTSRSSSRRPSPAPRGSSSSTRSRAARSRAKFISSVQKGIESALDQGPLAGYPMEAIKARLYDGKFHNVDSDQLSFEIAGRMALREAARRASPVIMEPIMKVEVITPEEYMGDVIGDLSSRRGRIEGMGQRGDAQVVDAFVPLSEMFGYSTDLRSNTQGRAIYSMQFDHYEEVPTSIAEEISAAGKAAA